MQAVKTEGLTYVYSHGTPFEKTAIKDISLEIESGDFIGVIGHTGSGKSTFIQHLNGLVRPTSGRVIINGRDIWEDPGKIRQVRFEVGLVFQYPEYQLFEETVERDIAFGPRNMGLSEAEISERVAQAAEFVGLAPETMSRSPFELSGGQKRRVAIAGVLAMRPSILILDEPTAGLDPRGRNQILSEIEDYHKKTSTTVLLVSHSMEDVARFANRILVINDGSVFTFDTVKNVFSHGEELAEMGLDLPQITRVMLKLRAMGYDVASDIFTVEAARTEILKLLSRKGGAVNA